MTKIGQVALRPTVNAARLIGLIEDLAGGLPASAIATLSRYVTAAVDSEKKTGKLDGEIEKLATDNEVAHRSTTVPEHPAMELHYPKASAMPAKHDSPRYISRAHLEHTLGQFPTNHADVAHRPPPTVV